MKAESIFVRFRLVVIVAFIRTLNKMRRSFSLDPGNYLINWTSGVL
jgi:hypothetical protein